MRSQFPSGQPGVHSVNVRDVGVSDMWEENNENRSSGGIELTGVELTAWMSYNFLTLVSFLVSFLGSLSYHGTLTGQCFSCVA